MSVVMSEPRELDEALRAATPQPGCQITRLPLGDAEVLVEYEYEEGEAAVWNLNSPMCGPGYSPIVAILNVYINGRWTRVEDVIAKNVIEAWETAILEEQCA